MRSNGVLQWFDRRMKDPCDGDVGNLDALKYLTVIIPSYERQDFLLRQMVFWRGTGVHLIIADGSELPLAEDVLKRGRDNLQVTYLHAQIGFSERLNVAGKHINTKYAVLSGDDEFLLKSGVCHAIFKLEEDSSLVACIGQSLGFYLTEDKSSVTYGSGYPHWKYEIRQDDSIERICAAMTNYTAATCYAILRADVWVRSWGGGRNWASPYVAEVQQAFSTYISGKLATVDAVYWMRSCENKPVSIKGSNRTLSFGEWWMSRRFASEREDLVDVLAKELVSTRAIDPLQARLHVEAAVEIFLSPERLKKDALFGFPALLAFLRSRAGKILRYILTDEQFIKLKDRIYASTETFRVGDFGSIRELSQLKGIVSISVNDELLAELSAMEILISEFWQARRNVVGASLVY